MIHFISKRFNKGALLPRSVRVMRTVTSIGIAIATAALMIAISVGIGFEKNYKKALMDFNSHIVLMGDDEAGSIDIEKVKNMSGEILAATPFVYREALVVGNGRINGVVVKGIDPATLQDVNPMKITMMDGSQGLKALDAPSSIIPVVAGKGLAAWLLAKGNGQSVKLFIERHFVRVKIIGSFESGLNDYDSQFLLMSMPVARGLFGMPKRAVTGLELKLSEPERAGEIADMLESELGPKYRTITWSELNSDLLAAVKLEKLVSAIIMGLMLFVAASNIVAVLVLITIHRLSEISTLKAIGATNSLVRGILTESGLGLGLSGALGGAVAGSLIAWLIQKFKLIPLDAEIYLINSLPVDFSFVICGITTFVCVLVCLAASFLAARKLAATPIAEGLRMAG